MNQKLKVGDKIKILSFPRRFDGSDGFAGTVGTIEKISYDDKYNHGQVGHIRLRLEDGATFTSIGITKMKFEIMYEKLN